MDSNKKFLTIREGVIGETVGFPIIGDIFQLWQMNLQ